jgi:hypothetical protein
MKSLYESILDDEDILMNDVKNHSNNPFRVLKYYYDEIDKTRSTDRQWGVKWREVVDKELKRIKLPKGVFYNVFIDHIKFMSRSGNLLFDIKFDDSTIESITKNDACCVTIDSTRDRSKSLSDDERKIVRDFCKQYDFKLTNPNHAYCMWLYLDK